MMKTLCVAAFVLSLTSVCQPASLACEKLLKPVDKGPDLSGRWYIVAVSAESCLLTSLLDSVLWLSLEVDITSTSTPNLYLYVSKFKMYGLCHHISTTILYENNTMFGVDINNAPTGKSEVLLQSGCSDCMPVKREYLGPLPLMLYSRSKNITDAELKEFESQAECLGWSKPQVLNSDHDENCPSLDDDDIDRMRIYSMIFQRLTTTFGAHLNCLTETFFHHFPTMAYEWVQRKWSALW